ncbi:hypothetical protein HHK36_005385 [Tetracentron sinense]|uniref:Reverse transcriptase Ty1/copia-type domain-containing protein n=1 Tax=Tetracentron sinense TaxID=13715 RepID=A0A834ZU25_TETSI|nr:hypothetical protein HHK36_005385 [Tetracentron sinense]
MTSVENSGCPTKSVKNKTPQEAWSGYKSSVSHLKIFGCIAYAQVPEAKRKKLDDRGEKCIFIGYSEESKAYKLYNPLTNKVVVSRDVIFSEEETWNWDKEEKIKENQIEIEEQESDHGEQNQANMRQTISTPAPRASSSIVWRSPDARLITPEGTSLTQSSTSSSSSIRPIKMRSLREIYEQTENNDDINLLCLYVDHEPLTFQEAVKENCWRSAMEEEIYAIQNNKTWELTSLPKGHKSIGVNQEMFDKFKHAMFKEFEMTDCGLMSYFLGIEVRQQADCIFISQKRYAMELLKKFRLDGCNTISTPVAMGSKLTKEREGKTVDSTLFKSLIGSLRYLTITRLDIVYGVGLLSRYMETPKESHWLAAKRILRYISGTLEFGLFYSYNEDAELYGYSDSDWGGDQDERKSTTGLCETFNRGEKATCPFFFYLGEHGLREPAAPISRSFSRRVSSPPLTMPLASLETHHIHSHHFASCDSVEGSHLLRERQGLSLVVSSLHSLLREDESQQQRQMN